MRRLLRTDDPMGSRQAPALLGSILMVLAAWATPANAQSSTPDPIVTTRAGDSGSASTAILGAPVSAGEAGNVPELPTVPAPEAATVCGTVLDTNDNVVPDARITIDRASQDDRRVINANENAAFQIAGLQPGMPYVLKVSAAGFADWTSQPIVLHPGQFLYLPDIRLKVNADPTSVTVYASSAEIATEQVRLEEQQRVLGFVPNYYVSYDGENAAPLSSRMKFQLAMKTATDPITIAGVFFLAGVDQAADTPDYQEGVRGYGQRVGAIGAEGFSNILIGGAILPSILHQDPRYFYQGTGSTRSRVVHALSAPFVARGDNGRPQINISSMGGDLAAGALANTWYPDSNRGAGMVFGSFALASGERVVNALAQEFVLPRLTSKGKSRLQQH